VIQSWDAKKKAWSDFDKIPLEDGMSTNLVGFDKKGTIVYMTDSRGGDTAGLYAVDLKSKKEKLIYADR